MTGFGPAGTGILFAAVTVLGITSAYPLSEIKREELPPIEGTAPETRPDESIPLPDTPDITTPSDEEKPAEADVPPGEMDLPLPEVLRDVEMLPAPARRMRELILEACQSGEIEALRPLIGTGAQITQLSLGRLEGDPINFLREISGDGEGHEIMAILEEVLEAGFVHLDPGTPEEIYVWPYFMAYPLDKLDDRQRVELFRIVTWGDFLDMQAFGGYNFYRAGITPEGQWAFFVAGD